MLEGVWYGIAAVLVFFGMVFIVCVISARIFRTDSCGRLVVLLSPEADRCDIGSLLYAAHIRFALWGNCRKGSIILVDNGLDENQLRLCRRIMSECGSMEMCKADALADVLTERKDNGFSA